MQYSGLPGALGNQKLIVGPWQHGKWNTTNQGELDFPENSILSEDSLAFALFMQFLKGEDFGYEDYPAVSCYIIGDCSNPDGIGNKWVEFDYWPPEDVVYDTCYLQPGLSWDWENAEGVDTGAYYFHNPEGAFMHNGGRNLFTRPGPKSQLLQDISAHGVIWTSEPLDTAITIAGPVYARIFASADCIDTDFMVRLCDVYPSGTSYLITDGAIGARFRDGTDHEVFMTPGGIYEFEIFLGNIAICFEPGHRIRFGISSALHNRYEANPNTGEPFRQNTYTQVANLRIYCDEEHPTSVVLPILPEFPLETAETKKIKPESISIRAYPNPFNSRISIDIPENTKSCKISDIMGNVINRFDKTNFESLISWSPDKKIESGIYLVEVKMFGGIVLIERIVYIK